MHFGEIRPNLKLTATNIMLVANAFVWYLLAFNTIRALLENLNLKLPNYEYVLVLGINAGAIAVSALIGSFVNDRFKRRTPFLNLWILAGIFISLMPLGLNVANINHVMVLSFVFGAYFGLGMPAVMGYYSDHTHVENRAKISGITFLVIGASFSMLGAVTIGNIIISSAILALIRIVGIFFLPMHQDKVQTNQEIQKVSYRYIISNRPFTLYFIAWCMLSLINYMALPIQSNLFSGNDNGDFTFLILILENIVMAISAVAVGFIADVVGRKRLTIIGFVLLGIGYAGLGLFTDVKLAGYFYVVADGIAWGIFNIMFLLTLWGDLAHTQGSDKFYFLGALPYLISNFMQGLLSSYLSDITGPEIFSFASVFLFLAVLPLFYAPETLPEKTIKNYELQSYLKQAQKVKEKYS